MTDTNIDTRLRKLEVEFLHGVPVKLPESAIAQIKQLIKEARIEELEYIKSQNVSIPCEPDCSELRHARHEGAWEQHLEFDADIDNRLAALQGEE